MSIATSRRQFLGAGLAATAASWVGVATLPMIAQCAQRAGLQLDRFVFDGRHAECVAIARHAGRCGVRSTQISGDLMDLWYNHLDLQWKRAPKALAGMTTRGALFVLERLAADYRMRVVYRGEHAAPRQSRIEHTLSGPADMLLHVSSAHDLFLWEALLGRAMTQFPAGSPANATARVEMTTAARGTALREEPLFSWIIAPRLSAARAA